MSISLLFLTLFWTQVVFGEQGCPHGFVLFQESCYFFSHGKESWIGAFDSCHLFGAMLVEINDRTENNFLSNKTHSFAPKESWWIGLTDKLVEGEYVWETSMSLLSADSFTNWASGEPNNAHGNENCVKLDGSHNAQWTDSECDQIQKYICKSR